MALGQNIIIENENAFAYLGHMITHGRDNQTVEVNRRRLQGWSAFVKLRNVLKKKTTKMDPYEVVYWKIQCVLK